MPERSEARLRAALALFYLLLVAFRSREFLAMGRFWAEEGRYFYPALAQTGPVGVVTFLFKGQLQLWTNLVMWLSTLVDVAHAPRVTTWGGALLQAVVPVVIIWRRRDLGLAPVSTFAWLAILVGMPQAYEGGANVVNLHFHAAVLVGVLVALAREGTGDVKSLGLLAAAGFAGVPPAFVTPVALLCAFYTRDLWTRRAAAVVGATTLLQAGIVFTCYQPDATRSFGIGAYNLARALFHHMVSTPLLGFKAGAALTNGFGNAEWRVAFGYLLIPLMTAAAAALLGAVDDVGRRLVASSLLLAMVSAAAAMGYKAGLSYGLDGGRYFFAPNALLYLALARAAEHRRGARLFLLAVAAQSLLGLMLPRPATLGPGPAWSDARKQPGERVAIWPVGWDMPRPN